MDERTTEAQPQSLGSLPASAVAAELNLSRAEAEVFRLLKRGHGSKQIAGQLRRSEKTVEVYRLRIAMKLGITLGFGPTLGLGVRLGMMGVLPILHLLAA